MLGGFKSTIIEVYKKVVKYDKQLNVIKNGEDNLYPERADRFINNSVTAKTCAKIMATYLAGKGWGDSDEIITNKAKGTKLKKFTENIAISFAKQRGVFIHVNYNANFKPSSFEVLPYTSCRLGKKDDNKYNGKIAVSYKWDENPKEEDIIYFDVFNPNKKIVESQIENSKGKTFVEKLKNYKGQILYVNIDDEYVYALSQIDPVMNDCDSEAQASVYKNKSLRKGFFGKTLIITKPLLGSLEDYPDEKEWALASSERENFKETIQQFIGAENVGDALHLELQYEDEAGIDKAIFFKDISSNIDDKIFSYTEESVFKNILMAFNSIPPALVRPENSVFSASGESIKAMQIVYQDNTEAERTSLIETVKMLMNLYLEEETELNLIPLIENDTISTTE
jgi:hypothetical protein